LSHTVTEKGTVTIPVEIRRKHNLKKGSKVKFIETEQGALIVPVLTLKDLRGVDKDRRELVYKMIKELHTERREEASLESYASTNLARDLSSQEDELPSISEVIRKGPKARGSSAEIIASQKRSRNARLSL